MKSMSIGELSKLSGVKITTIRYYEQVGLISKPERSAGGRRMYREEDLQRLIFIRHSRQLGFSPDAIRSLIELQAPAKPKPLPQCSAPLPNADAQAAA